MADMERARRAGLRIVAFAVAGALILGSCGGGSNGASSASTQTTRVDAEPGFVERTCPSQYERAGEQVSYQPGDYETIAHAMADLCGDGPPAPDAAPPTTNAWSPVPCSDSIDAATSALDDALDLADDDPQRFLADTETMASGLQSLGVAIGTRCTSEIEEAITEVVEHLAGQAASRGAAARAAIQGIVHGLCGPGSDLANLALSARAGEYCEDPSLLLTATTTTTTSRPQSARKALMCDGVRLVDVKGDGSCGAILRSASQLVPESLAQPGSQVAQLTVLFVCLAIQGSTPEDGDAAHRALARSLISTGYCDGDISLIRVG